MSDSVTSFLPSPTPFPSDSFPSLTSTPALANAITTEHSSPLNNDSQIEQGPPIAAIAGAGAGAVILIIAVTIWYLIRRRRRQQQQQQSKSNAVSPSSSPSSSSKPRVQQNHNLDLEKQLDIATPPSTTTNDNPSILPTFPNDTNNKQQTSSPVLYSSSNNVNNDICQEDSTVRAKKKASQQSMRQQNRRSPSIQSQASARTNVSGAIAIDMEASTPPVPPRRESMHYQPEAALELQKQLGTTSTGKDPSSVQMPVPPSTPASPPSSSVHIDMVSLDLEKLMPIVISEELRVPGEERPATTTTTPTAPTTISVPPVASPQIPVEPSTPVPRPPVHFATEVIPTPVPRRPSMMSRKSTDSVRSRVGSACHPPPPPPPSIPLPALPMTNPCGMDARGRRSTASSNRGSTPSRRSISLESATRWAREGGSDSNNTSARNSQDSFSKSSTPSSPPSSVASSSPAFQQHARMPSRSRHQRCPSQVLGTQFFTSSEQGPTSPPLQHRRPISPPLAPLTVQIPRTSSRSIHTYFSGPQQQPTFTTPAQPESPTIGSFETSPVVSPTCSIIAELPSSIASRTSAHRPSYLNPTGYPTPSQRSRSRSISQSSAETHRIALPGATCTSLPPVPSMPSMLGDHLPPPPPSHSFLLRRYPSLLQHRPSSGSLNSMDQDSSSDHHHDDNDMDRSRRKRRSMSVDSAGRWISSQHGSSCSVSPIPGSTPGQEHAEDSDPLARQDQEVQAIIADAIAIAQAKSAAVQAARQSTWYRQYQQQQQQMMQLQMQQQQQQMQQLQKAVGSGGNSFGNKAGPVNTSPWTPSESHFTEEKTTVSVCTSRSSSPFYSSLD